MMTMNHDVLLEGRDLHKSFGATPALRGANVAVRAGEVLAIMGPSGSGKSTLHCLAGIVMPEIGEVTFAGRRVDKMGDDERTTLRRRDFGFVFQFGQLAPELTAEDNVAIPLLLNGRPRGDSFREARVWLERLRLSGKGGRRSGELSGGEARRVAIVRTVVTKPQVLFAEEPTGSLDSLTGETVMDLFLEAARESNTTVVIVTHEPRIAAYADREIMVRDGVAADEVIGGRR
ncbi:MAG: ABC transporter ATP-binding protein [Thermomicrobiales bacterium]